MNKAAPFRKFCHFGIVSDNVRPPKVRMAILRIHQERQINPIADEVAALTAVVRPILKGVLYALKEDIVVQASGRENLSLALLTRLYRAGDRDCGICFEYAVHEAMNRGDPQVLNRVNDAIRLCRIQGTISVPYSP